MRFNPKARLDRSRVGDAGRGGGGGGAFPGGGMRMPIPGGMAGGGIGTLIIIVLFIVLTQCVGGGGGLPSPGGGGDLDTSRVDGSDSGRYDQCETGEDANNSPDCARVAVENSLTDYWSQALPDQSGKQFSPEQTTAAIVVHHPEAKYYGLARTGGNESGISATGEIRGPATAETANVA